VRAARERDKSCEREREAVRAAAVRAAIHRAPIVALIAAGNTAAGASIEAPGNPDNAALENPDNAALENPDNAALENPDNATLENPDNATQAVQRCPGVMHVHDSVRYACIAVRDLYRVIHAQQHTYVQ
jgi:hypothetical protein